MLASMPPNPFGEDKDLFDEFFAEETTVTEFAEDNDAVFGELAKMPSASAANPHDLPDPFGTATTMTASTASPPAAAPTELTVIIDDPKTGRRMVVIPKPSPWLLELLTGEKPGEATGVATSHQRILSTTSARGSAK